MKSIFAVVLLLCLVSSSFQVTIYEGDEPGDFDFYLFVQQWIYSYCGSQTCVSSKVREAFTIHGLWPDNSDGSYPSFCDGPTFSESAISSLLNQLNYDWPSLTGPNTDFWTHEWSKHGTCSITGPITDQKSYFESALNLYEKYNITQALEKHSVYPSSSKTYTSSEIVNAIYDEFGYNPVIQCSSGELSTLALCVTKDLELMNCPKLSGWSCSGSIKIPSTDGNNDSYNSYSADSSYY